MPYPGFADVTVAGVPCRAVRTGFVGELAFELHHPRRRGPDLWRALVEAGREWDLRPHGLDALELLRLEKGHVYLGQDTMPDDTPAKLRMSWAVDMSKPWFVGKRALERMSSLPPSRRQVGLEFSGGPADTAALRGEPLIVSGTVVGRITSAERSIALDRAIGLGWVRTVDGWVPGATRDGVRGDGEGRADPVLRSGRRADAWLSCGSSIRRSSWCWLRGRPATRSRRPTARRRCASPPGS